MACSGSSGGATVAALSPSSTKPAHDYRNIPELEQFVTNEFNKAYADPTDAKYLPGVTVKSVLCAQEAGTSAYTCKVTPSKGPGMNWNYIVAADGDSVEHGLPRG